MSATPTDPATADPAGATSSRPNPVLSGAALLAAVGLLLLGVAAVRVAFQGPEDAADAPRGEAVAEAPASAEDAGDAADEGASAGDEASEPADDSDEGDTGDDTASDADAGADAGGSDDADDAGGAAGDAAPAATPSDAAAAIAKALGPAFVVVRVVEDWGGMATPDELERAIVRNLGVGDNELALAPLTAAAAPGPLGGLLWTWRVGADAPHDFVGFDRDLPREQAWEGATHLALWADPGTRPRGDLVLQFREASDEVWRHEVPAATLTPEGPYLVPLTTDAFAWAPWSREANGAIDLAAVNRVGLYAGHDGAGLSGGLRLGALAAVRNIDDR